MNLNRVQLAGNLTRDVELKYSATGTPIARMGLAVNRKWTDKKTGEKKEEATFCDVDAFGKQAEVLAQYFKKGKPIYLEGRLRMESWMDKATGQKRSKLGVVLESFEFLGGNEGGGQSAPAKALQPADADALPQDDDAPLPF